MRRWFLFAGLVCLGIILGCLGGGGGGGGGGTSLGVGPGGVVLSGRVYYQERSLYGGIPILARNSSGETVSTTRTDSSGNFAFSTLPAGVYDILATTGDSETVFESGVQVTVSTQKPLSEKALLSLTKVVLDQVTSSSVRITFTSNQSSTSLVKFGTAEDAGTTVNVLSAAGTSHQITISGLSPSTRYSFALTLRGTDGQVFNFPGLYTKTCGSTGPTRLGLNLDNGAFETRDTMVTGYLQADNAAYMRCGDSEDLSAIAWESYSNTKEITLSSGDGTKTIYAQFKDSNGNLSTVISDSILLSTSSTGYLGVWINGGKSLTNVQSVLITLLFPGATQMMISDRADFFKAYWETFTEIRKWSLSSTDGTKKVYVKFSGGGADPTQVFTASIILDTTGPEMALKINGGISKTNTRTVTLSFTGGEEPVDMQVINWDQSAAPGTSDFKAGVTWLAFVSSMSWELSAKAAAAEDDTKVVAARFRDQVGNISVPVTAQILLDTTPPTGYDFKFNDSATSTKTLQVVLNMISPSEVDGTTKQAKYFRISNSEDFTGSVQEAFKSAKSWTLNGYGLQNVFMTFTDDASNSSDAVTKSITVDIAPPGSDSIKINDDDQFTESATATLTLFSAEALKYRISRNGNFGTILDSLYTPNTTLDIPNFSLNPKAGLQTFYVRFENASGEYSIRNDSIQVVGPASGSLSTNDSQPLATYVVNLKLFATGVSEMIVTESYPDLASFSAWRTFQYTLPFTMASTSGWHTIYAKFRNAGGVETEVFSLNVQTAGPTLGSETIIINGGDSQTDSATVSVRVFSSTAQTFKLSTNLVFESVPSYNYTPGPPDNTHLVTGFPVSRKPGVQAVNARFVNSLGGVTFASDSILVTGPTSYTIALADSGAVYNFAARLKTPAVGAYQILLTEDSSQLDNPLLWQSYVSSLSFPLTPFYGVHTIYGKFRNANLVETEVLNVQIEVRQLSYATPTISINDGDFATDQASVSITLSSTNAVRVNLSHDGVFDPATERVFLSNVVGNPYLMRVTDFPLLSVKGDQSVYAKFIDASSAAYITSDQIKVNGPTVTSFVLLDPAPNYDFTVHLQTLAQNAASMLLTEDPGLTSSPGLWQPYVSSTTFNLIASYGAHVIYLRFRNSGGIESDLTTLAVTITQSPSTIVVNEGDIQTQTATVSLTLYSRTAQWIRVSLDGAFESATNTAWVENVPGKPDTMRINNFPLKRSPGVQTAWVRFEDSGGNFLIASDSIQVIGPTNESVTTDDTQPLAGFSVNVKLFANNATQYLLTENFLNLDDPALWKALVASVSFNLMLTEGGHTLYGKFRNSGGIESGIATLAVTVTLPANATPAISINGGADQTTQTAATISVRAPAMTTLWLSNSNDFSGATPVPIATSAFQVPWTLQKSIGTQIVYARFDDGSGNFIHVQDSILVFGPTDGAISTNDQLPLSGFTVNVKLYALNASQYLLTENFLSLDDPLLWKPMVASLSYPLIPVEGAHTLFGKFRNAGGIETGVSTLSLNVVLPATAAPSIVINSGDDQANRTIATITVHAPGKTTVWLANANDFSGATAIPLSTWTMNLPWTLDNTAGTKWVYARFDDGAGSMTFASDSITLSGPTTPTLSTDDTEPLNRSYVNLKIETQGAAEMILSEDINAMTATSGWVPFTANQVFNLIPGGGTHRIYGKFRNTSAAGYVQIQATSLSVRLRQSPPDGNTAAIRETILSTSPAIATTTNDLLPVFLHFAISDSSTASISWAMTVQGASIPTVFTDLVPPVAPISLNPGTGTFTVWYRFADGVGNCTQLAYLNLEVTSLASVKPSFVLINNGDAQTDSATVSVKISSADCATFQMSIVPNTFAGCPEYPYGPPTFVVQPDGSIIVNNFSLKSEAGEQSVYVKLISSGGSVSSITDSITINGPTGFILATKDAMPLATYVVNLRPNAVGAVEMLITEDPAILNSPTAPWASFSYNFNYSLLPFAGSHTVWGKCRNAGKVETEAASLSVDVSPPNATVLLNDGDSFTDTASATIRLFSSDALFYQVSSRSSFVGVPQTPYVANQPDGSVVSSFTLLPNAGSQNVYVRFDNGASTAVASDAIDIVGPSNAAISTPDTLPLTVFQINLRPFADGATEMLLTEDYSLVSSESLWIPFAFNTTFVLQPTYGVHKIYAKYRNTGRIETSLLTLDVVATGATNPDPYILLNGGDATVNQPGITVNVCAPGQAVMRLSNDGNFAAATDTVPADRSWFLNPARAGTRTVFSRFQDASGTYRFASDTITAVGPASCSIWTNDTLPLNRSFVNLSLYAENAVGMIVSEDPAAMNSSTLWIPYQNSLVFNLPGGTSQHTIYAKFSNASTTYIESEPLSIQVTVNSTPPTGNTGTLRETAAPTSAEVTSVPIASLPIYLHFSITDPNTATISWQLADSGSPVPTSFHQQSIPVAPIGLSEADFPGNGTWNLFYKFTDGVGNETPLEIISVDVLGPSLEISPAAAGPFYSGQSQQFAATLKNVEGTVLWSLDPAGATYGTIDSIGKYTAPSSVTLATQTWVRAQVSGYPLASDAVKIKIETQIEVLSDTDSFQISCGATRTVLITFRNSYLGGSASVFPISGGGVATISAPASGTPGTDAIATLTYVAPVAPPTGNVTVTVTSDQDPTKTKLLTFQVNSGPWISLDPVSASTRVRTGNFGFSAATSDDSNIPPATVTWTISYGSFSPSALVQTLVTTPPHSVTFYASNTFPAVNPTPIMATFTSGAVTRLATGSITLTSPVVLSLTPKSDQLSIATTTGITFQADVQNATTTQVTWEYKNASGTTWYSAGTTSSPDTGLLSLFGNNGIFNAPATFPAGMGPLVQVRATSVDDSLASDVATITLLSPVEVVIHKGYDASAEVATETTVTLEVGKQQFFAELKNAKSGSNLTVSWFIEDIAGGNTTFGTVDSTGKYSAPDSKVQSYVILKAKSNADPSRYAECKIYLENFWAPRSQNLQDVTNATDSIYFMLIDPTTASGSDKRAYAATNGHGVYWANIAQFATGTDWASIPWQGSDLSNTAVGAGGQYVVNSLDLSRQNSNRVVAATNDGVWFSNNSGVNFTRLVVPTVRPESHWFDPASASYDTVFTSFFSSVMIDPTDDRYLYALGKDQGILRFIWSGGISSYTYDGTIMDDRQRFSVYRWFTDNYVVYDASGTPTPKTVERLGVYNYSASSSMQLNCMAIDPQNPSVLYVGFSHFLRTRDPDSFTNGYFKLTNVRSSHYLYIWTTSLYPYGVDFSTSATETPIIDFQFMDIGCSGIRNEQGSGLILSMAVDPNTPTTIWAGKNSGIERTTDDGITWNVKGAYSNVRDVFIDPINTINVFIGTEAGLYRTSDAGGSWKQIKTGLEGHTTINSLDLSPGGIGSRRIFSGTTGGLYMGVTSLDLE